MLERIMSPADLKALDDGELRELAAELRERIISIVSMNGGHLASNLGTVELTLALHAELDCPRDKLIFDVGHQAYAHKLLTGRYKEFSTIRREGGLSGFPRRGESEYDAFSVGHASTAISAALGMARARRAGRGLSRDGGGGRRGAYRRHVLRGAQRPGHVAHAHDDYLK